MKLINRILSIISAGIMAVTCSLTAFADAPYDDAIVCNPGGGYKVNIIYDNDKLIVYENESFQFEEYKNKKYNFSMNYVIMHNDGIVTSEWFGLSEEYTVKQTAYDDKTETYTVKAESYEELNKLYEASAELLEKGIIENAYKQYTYNYGCFQNVGCAEILLNKADENFNPNLIEGLEDVEFERNDEQPNIYHCDATLENVIAIYKSEENILATENVMDLTTFFCSCLVLHEPKTIRIYIDGCPENAEIEPMSISGDADMNGFVDVQDCAFIARNIAEGKTGEISKYADFNEDGKVNIRDAAALAGYFASLYGSSNY